MKDFARGSMRTYRILREKAREMREHPEIQDLLASIQKHARDHADLAARYTKESARKLGSLQVDRRGLGEAGLEYERLDQLVTELLLGSRAAGKAKGARK